MPVSTDYFCPRCCSGTGDLEPPCCGCESITGTGTASGTGIDGNLDPVWATGGCVPSGCPCLCFVGRLDKHTPVGDETCRWFGVADAGACGVYQVFLTCRGGVWRIWGESDKATFESGVSGSGLQEGASSCSPLFLDFIAQSTIKPFPISVPGCVFTQPFHIFVTG